MRLSRRTRKLINEIKVESYARGYAEGYAKGLHDGNPFNAIVDAVTNMVNTLNDNPELLAEAARLRAAEIEPLEIEGMEGEDGN